MFKVVNSKLKVGEKLEKLRELLESGADINARNEYGNTLIMREINKSRSNRTIIKFLINAGADINIRDNNGYTPLMHAGTKINFAQDLIDAGANVNAVDNDGQTALIIWCRGYRQHFISVLIDAGADASIKDKDGNSALSYIPAYQLDTIKLLIVAGADINFIYSTGQTFLITLSMNYSMCPKDSIHEKIKFLITAGADVNIKDKDGNTALKFLIENKHKAERYGNDYIINRNDELIELLRLAGAVD